MAQQEQHARETIDELLTGAGWVVGDASKINILAHRGLAIRELPQQMPPTVTGRRHTPRAQVLSGSGSILPPASTTYPEPR